MNIPRKNILEWSVFALGLALVTAVLWFLIRTGFTVAHTPADPIAYAGEPVRTQDGYLLPVTLKNRGGSTAEEVGVEVTLAGASGEPETGEFSVPFLPRHATRSGSVVFQGDPAKGALTVRVTGFHTP